MVSIATQIEYNQRLNRYHAKAVRESWCCGFIVGTFAGILFGWLVL